MLIQKKTLWFLAPLHELSDKIGTKETNHNIQMKLHNKLMSTFKTRRSRKLVISISLTM